MKNLAIYLLIPTILMGCLGSNSNIEEQTVKKHIPTKPHHTEYAPKKVNKTKSYTWSAPSSWEKKVGSSMRIGSFQLPGKGDVSVIVLGGAGGGIVPNINRWRSQVGLQHFSEKEVLDSLKEATSKIGTFKYSVILGTESKQGIIGAILLDDNKALFVKLTGANEVISKNIKDFDSFLRSFNVSN